MTKFIDSDIQRCLEKRIAVIGILLPSFIEIESKGVAKDYPVRIKDNLENGYCTIYSWTNNIDDLSNYIEEGKTNAIKNQPNNLRFKFGSKKRENGTSKKFCIFISHKKEDKSRAELIVHYINQVGIDTYLDIFDTNLQNNVKAQNLGGIVNTIQDEVKLSSELMCLISSKTKSSWWVPFEIGLAKAYNKEISSVIWENSMIHNLPEYLAIIPSLKSKDEFESYISRILNRTNLYLPSGTLENNRNILQKIFIEKERKMAIFDLNNYTSLEELKREIETSDISDIKLLAESYIGKFNDEEREYNKAVFLSHKSTYKSQIKILADYFDKNEFDVYLDTKDEFLKEMTDSFEVSKSFIKKMLEYGIDNSEYLLCLISPDIEEGNWIKYEINMAEEKNKAISGIPFQIDIIPKLFKGHKLLNTESDLRDYYEISQKIAGSSINNLDDIFN